MKRLLEKNELIVEVTLSCSCSLAFTQTQCNFPNSMGRPSASPVSGPGRNGPVVPLAIGVGFSERQGEGEAAACVPLMNRTWCQPLIFCPARGWSLALNGGPLLYKELRFPTIVRAAAPAARLERGQGGKHRCRPDTTRCQRHETVMQIAESLCVCLQTEGVHHLIVLISLHEFIRV